MTINMRQSYFYVPVKRPIFIQIPAEDREAGDKDMIAQLNLSIYGTRDAAQNKTEAYTKFLMEKTSPKAVTTRTILR